MLEDRLPTNWSQYVDKDVLRELGDFLLNEKEPWHPAPENVFRALDLTLPKDLRVVWLGMDPYPTEGVPNGLAFSVNPDVQPLPKSLVNIFKEYESDLGLKAPLIGDLTPWARSGVLLINSALTCRVGQSGSHMRQWEPFSKTLLQRVAQNNKDLVFILLGANAKQRVKDLDLSDHHIVESVHPSPLSAYRGFFGSKIFSRTNQILEENGKAPIDWTL